MAESKCCECFTAVKVLLGTRDKTIMSHLRSSQSLHGKFGQDSMSVQKIRMHKDPGRSFRQLYSTDLCEQLGGGAFGTVWKSFVKKTGKEVAVKIIQKGNLQNLNLLNSELEILTRLDHPNVLKLYEYFEDEVAVYVVTELATGGDLLAFAEAVHNEDVLLEKQVSDVFRQILQALAYCHSPEIEVAHRDLKAENCLFTDQSRETIKIIDFGLSTVGCSERWTCGKVAVGTPGYMSPEMIQMKSRGVETDIWSAGVILFLCLTGHMPFSNVNCRTQEEFFEVILGTPYSQDKLIEADISEEACDLIDRMLQKDPADRPTAAEALWHPFVNARRKSDFRFVKDAKYMIKAFRGAKESRFESAIVAIMAHQITEDEVTEVLRAFSAFDKEGAGCITIDVIQKTFESHDVNLSREDLENFFEMNDGNGDGSLQYSEWLAATLKPDLIAADAAVEEAFSFFDTDNTGVITRENLLEVVSEEEADKIMDGKCGRFGRRLQNGICLSDFQTICRNIAADRRLQETVARKPSVKEAVSNLRRRSAF
eukprot:TRINITY_DN22760_c0_g1_i1.p1 TRINITY_DN22760_c0_g1~~TRINITY_DN22760_c0_g1_i1.p1  ORF type:complete len:563 (-),score=100.55 TRINITY_DN22760_c0_g1_i1:109-1725(-)